MVIVIVIVIKAPVVVVLKKTCRRRGVKSRDTKKVEILTRLDEGETR
jgi:hypothetical protein